MTQGLGSAERGQSNPQTMREFMERMLAAFPDAEVGEDNDHQLVIYTGLVNIGDDPENDRCTVLTYEEAYPDGIVPTDRSGSGLCDACKVPAHDVCGQTIGCRCCDDTIAQKAEYDLRLGTSPRPGGAV